MNINGRGGSFGKMGAEAVKPKSTWITIKRLLGTMKNSSLLIVIALLIAIVGTAMQVATPKILGRATNIIFSSIKVQTGIDFSKFGVILLTVGAMYLVTFIAAFLQERIMTIVSLKTTETLRNAVKAKLNKVPILYFDKHSTGELMSVAANDIDNISTNLQQSITQLISSIILVVGSLAIMITISPMLTLLSCIIIPASVLITKLLSPLVQRNSKKYMQSMGRLNGNIEETFQNFTLIKSFEGEKEALETFQKSNGDIRQSGWRAKFFGMSMMHIMMLVQNATYVLIAAMGAMRVISGTIMIGDLQAFLQYSGQFASPISRMSQIWASLLSAIASAERVFEIMDTDEMTVYQKEFENVTTSSKVLFNKVKFGYNATPLMNDFNLAVNNGQTIAIVGHTGAGKTTLVNLLERFYEIQGGSINIDGIDIRNMSYDNLRCQISMVLQDTWLFSGTIYDNIKFGNENATDEQIYAAAKASFADDFIQKLPDRYNTLLGEDAGNISQGQKQLITIARAFVADPEIIILDEATSSVDSRTEMVIQKAMQRLLKGRTSFVVAHRLSTIYNADNIIVMKDGDIVETGKHNELIAQNGVYADIYSSQFSNNVA
jgi:ATP-binding cassette subfamily B protein